jgi:hypothetical protein
MQRGFHLLSPPSAFAGTRLFGGFSVLPVRTCLMLLDIMLFGYSPPAA